MEEVKVSVSVGSVTTIVPAQACAFFCRRFKRMVVEKVKITRTRDRARARARARGSNKL